MGPYILAHSGLTLATPSGLAGKQSRGKVRGSRRSEELTVRINLPVFQNRLPDSWNEVNSMPTQLGLWCLLWTNMAKVIDRTRWGTVSLTPFFFFLLLLYCDPIDERTKSWVCVMAVCTVTRYIYIYISVWPRFYIHWQCWAVGMTCTQRARPKVITHVNDGLALSVGLAADYEQSWNVKTLGR